MRKTIAAVLVLGLCAPGFAAAAADPTAPGPQAEGESGDEEDVEEDLRERLTEREDKRRPSAPGAC
jgi:hypothetical protein